MYSRRTKKWVRTQYQGVYEIFGSLSVVYMIIERYARNKYSWKIPGGKALIDIIL